MSRTPLLAMLGSLLALTACRSGTSRAPEAEVRDDRPVVTVEGRRWVVEHEASVPPLRPEARLMGLLAWDARWACPRTETYFVRAPGGAIAPVKKTADLLPFVKPITTGDEAIAYARFLRLFDLPKDEVPGLVEGSPDRGGVITSLMEDDLSKEGIDPTPQVTATASGFVLARLVVTYDAEGAPILVRLREMVGRDGAYVAQVLETVKKGDAVRAWIWAAC